MRLDVYVCMYVCMYARVSVCDIDCVGGPMRRRHGDAVAERNGRGCVDQMWRWALLSTGKRDARAVMG